MLNPLKHGGEGGCSLAFCLLLNISWDNPLLNILENIFVADAPMKKKIFKK